MHEQPFQTCAECAQKRNDLRDLVTKHRGPVAGAAVFDLALATQAAQSLLPDQAWQSGAEELGAVAGHVILTDGRIREMVAMLRNLVRENLREQLHHASRVLIRLQAFVAARLEAYLIERVEQPLPELPDMNDRPDLEQDIRNEVRGQGADARAQDVAIVIARACRIMVTTWPESELPVSDMTTKAIACLGNAEHCFGCAQALRMTVRLSARQMGSHAVPMVRPSMRFALWLRQVLLAEGRRAAN